MDLIAEPDIYAPSVDDTGTYTDKIPAFNNIKQGLRCPCGSRKDKIYATHSIFSQHIKTKTHSKWLEDINANRTNFYIDNIKLNELVNNQKIIIARLEQNCHNKSMTIDYLTQQLHSNIQPKTDLLLFD